jgi:YebC/PmpR family DNA-binding regulatory protein
VAGHSHSANVARRKNAVDAKRAKVWSKIARKMIVAAKRGADPAMNLALRYVVEEAKAANMPKDTIQKAIDKGSGAAGTDNFEAVTYEAYGPGGVAMLIETLTDNRSRTAPDLRSTLDKYGGNLATSGAVSFVFTRRGVLLFRKDAVAEEQLIDWALEAGAEDVLTGGDYHEVLTGPTEFHAVKEQLEQRGLTPEDARIANLPNTTVTLPPEFSDRFNKLIEVLEDNDDVQSVEHNAAS